ncbi:hypothetical protein STCU_05123 [Strigomonas culicis]|uniref:Alpha-glycerophosphate oxidase C-terminal domain-containing protein n=1 Tax=Strigomonas culicis TaxID=28005 RepID=S9UI82_9TRYP|nr:hypothetical protein STCU_05123 [Strigomonas culicis]|eukprot:EPY28454.1 hypothetical protein STCU_05123 [Strigomonas culicis]
MQLPGGAAALQVCSTLYSFSASLVLPWADGCCLLGPSISPIALPAVMRDAWKKNDNYMRVAALRSQDGFAAQKARIVEILRTCGVAVDRPRILSCVSHVVPVMKDHHAVPWVGDVLRRGYHIAVSQPALPEGAPPLPFVHVYGGSTSLARTIAAEAVNGVLQRTGCLPATHRAHTAPCRTAQLRLVCPAAWRPSPSDVVTEVEALSRLQSLIADTYVEHLDDVIFRRTRVGYTSPAEALQLLPATAAMVAAARGWSDKRREAEVRTCKALLRDLAVH